MMDDLISRQDAIDALWKALYEYEDRAEKQFRESDELDVSDWFQHRIFVQNMNDIDRQTILNLPSAPQERKTGRWEIGTTPPTVGTYCNNCGWAWSNHIDAVKLEPVLSRIKTNYCPNCGAKME